MEGTYAGRWAGVKALTNSAKRWDVDAALMLAHPGAFLDNSRPGRTAAQECCRDQPTGGKRPGCSVDERAEPRRARTAPVARNCAIGRVIGWRVRAITWVRCPLKRAHSKPGPRRPCWNGYNRNGAGYRPRNHRPTGNPGDLDDGGLAAFNEGTDLLQRLEPSRMQRRDHRPMIPTAPP